MRPSSLPYTHYAGLDTLGGLAPDSRARARAREPEDVDYVADASLARSCCACGAWDITLCPAIRCACRAVRWFFLSANESAMLEQARALFEIVNREHRDCCSACCLIEGLSESERMLLVRVLQDAGGRRGGVLPPIGEFRDGGGGADASARAIMRVWAQNLREYAGERTDGGDMITRDEFEDALLRAVRECTVATIQTVGKRVLAEYERADAAARPSDFAVAHETAF